MRQQLVKGQCTNEKLQHCCRQGDLRPTLCVQDGVSGEPVAALRGGEKKP